MNIGCHVSIAGGIQNAPPNAHDLNCECFQMFTRSPQGGKAPELTENIIQSFKNKNSKFGIHEIYIHTPYYINFASADNHIRYGSVSVIREELERGNLLGAKYIMTHLGSAREYGHEKAMKKVAEMVEKSLEGYAGKTKLLFENSAGAGAIIGDNLQELSEIIKKINSPVIAGICLDTQHSFASGYDWRDFEATLKRIDAEIGIENIKLIHANDSQSEVASKKDRHEHIGKGKIGIETFGKIVDLAKENEIDMVCETDWTKVKEDIRILKELRKKI